MTNTKVGPIEVWLTQSHLEVTGSVVHENESTASLDVTSLSMRGAQREITGYFISQGYKPVGRWYPEAVDRGGEVLQASRNFKPAAG